MLGAFQKIAQKPSDKKIRITRIIFALLLALSIYFGIFTTDVNVSIFDYKFFDIPHDEYIIPVLFIFPLIGLIRGIFDPGIFRKAIWKKVIVSLGALMMIFSVFFLSEKENQPSIQINDSAELTADNLEQKPQINSSISPTDDLLFFFGLITIFVGFFLNNKNLTTKNEKFGEVIKKIRV